MNSRHVVQCLLALAGTTWYGYSFFPVAPREIAFFFAAIGGAAGVSWIVLGLVLVLFARVVAPARWFDICLSTMTRGMGFLLVAAAVNTVYPIWKQGTVAAVLLHVALLVGSGSVMTSTFATLGRLAGVSTPRALVLWFAGLQFPFVVMMGRIRVVEVDVIPLTMVGRLDPCVLLAYDAPAEQVRPLVPSPLRAVEREGRAFWNVVVCRVDKMRPAGVPRALGLSYVHVAYRIYVTCQTTDGRRVDGLYFVRSDVDRALIAITGNSASDFRFHTSTVDLSYDDAQVNLSLQSRGGYNAQLTVTSAPAPAPVDALLKYQPLGLGCTPGKSVVRLADVFRDEDAWSEQNARAEHAHFQFFQTMAQDVRLLKTTRVAAIDYRWRLGKSIAVIPP